MFVNLLSSPRWCVKRFFGWSNFDFFFNFEGAYVASKSEGESICGAQVQMLSALSGPKSSLLADGYHKVLLPAV